MSGTTPKSHVYRHGQKDNMRRQTIEDGRRVYEELMATIKKGKGVIQMARKKVKAKAKRRTPKKGRKQ